MNRRQFLSRSAVGVTVLTVQLKPAFAAIPAPTGVRVHLDSASHGVMVCDDSGRELWRLQGLGANPGQLNFPCASCVDSQGRVYIVDLGNHRVQLFNREGRFLHELRQGDGVRLMYPRDVTVDSRGHVYVCDAGNHRVCVFDATGRFLHGFGGLGSRPGNLNSPRSAVIASDGSIYVADSGNARVVVFSAQGRFLRQIGGSAPSDGGFRYPRRVALTEHGHLVVEDRVAATVVSFKPDGQLADRRTLEVSLPPHRAGSERA